MRGAIGAAALLAVACAGEQGFPPAQALSGPAPMPAGLAPHVLVLLDPAVLRRYALESVPLDDLQARCDAAGFAEGSAAVRLNRGALAWDAGDAGSAFELVHEARRRFAELADEDGVAHAEEWLGYMLARSGETAPAERHLARAYRLYAAHANRTAMDRILAYAN